MKRNINGFRLTKNGKPITIESNQRRHIDYQGASYKSGGDYYLFSRVVNGYHVYTK